VIAGAEDRITPASVVRRVAEKYKAVSTYREFKNHAHWVVAEPGWQEIADYAAEWLGQIPEG
jgi:pimeloyl-ACP methyl ester carboxylesterase